MLSQEQEMEENALSRAFSFSSRNWEIASKRKGNGGKQEFLKRKCNEAPVSRHASNSTNQPHYSLLAT